MARPPKRAAKPPAESKPKPRPAAKPSGRKPKTKSGRKGSSVKYGVPYLSENMGIDRPVIRRYLRQIFGPKGKTYDFETFEKADEIIGQIQELIEKGRSRGGRKKSKDLPEEIATGADH